MGEYGLTYDFENWNFEKFRFDIVAIQDLIENEGKNAFAEKFMSIFMIIWSIRT